jgi:hypothetical protein
VYRGAIDQGQTALARSLSDGAQGQISNWPQHPFASASPIPSPFPIESESERVSVGISASSALEWVDTMELSAGFNTHQGLIRQLQAGMSSGPTPAPAPAPATSVNGILGQLASAYTGAVDSLQNVFLAQVHYQYRMNCVALYSCCNTVQ